MLPLSAALVAAMPAAAQAPRTVTRSAVYVERMEPGNVRRLAPAEQLRRGERVVTIVTWQRAADGANESGGFTITNPLPGAIAYEDGARDDGEVSVDGGRTWGRIGELRIGGRLASVEDVTHLRWRIAGPSAARGRGQIAYSGIVR